MKGFVTLWFFKARERFHCQFKFSEEVMMPSSDDVSAFKYEFEAAA